LRSYTYDHANRLTQVVSGTLTTGFTYNGAGDRVAKTVDSVETWYTLDPAAGLTQVLQETTGGQTTSYLYGHDLLAQYDSGTWAYHVNDGLGSVRQLVDPTGQVVQGYSFSPFGVPLGESGGEPYGFTGEQWDASAGLVYLRARYYDVGTGRFISKEPLSGFVTRPQSLNRWVYVKNNPVNRRDPTGLREDEGCERCGPNIDDWFLEEIKIHWDWVAHEKAIYDLDSMRLCPPTNPLDPDWCLAERRTAWVFKIRDYLKAIPYKWMNFSDLVSGCPSSVLCRNTVTLCDTCLERSELGNIMFGFSSQVTGFSNWFTFWAGHDRAKGLQETWDQAAAGAGYYFGQHNLVPPHSDTMCEIFRGSIGVWKNWRGQTQPGTTPWAWKFVQDACTRMCEPCITPIPASTPHTKPAYAGEPAGKSWFAGAPKYIYYTEQIPEGMLDPRLTRFPLEEK
jgi:RHS repeat-associated protein